MSTVKQKMFVKVADAAQILSLTPSRIYQMLDGGELSGEMRYAEGRGWHPTMMVDSDSIHDYARIRYGMRPNSVLARRFEVMVNQYKDAERTLTPAMLTDILARFDLGESVYSLARASGVSNGSMRTLLQSHGRALRDQRRAFDLRTQLWVNSLPPDVRQYTLARYREGAGMPRISEELGWGKPGAKKIRKILEALGEPLRTRSSAARAFWQARKEGQEAERQVAA
jgi:hypothetical protein